MRHEDFICENLSELVDKIDLVGSLLWEKLIQGKVISLNDVKFIKVPY